MDDLKKKLIEMEKEDLAKLILDEEIQSKLDVKVNTQEDITGIVNRALAPKLERIRTLQTELEEQKKIISEKTYADSESDTTGESKYQTQIENLKKLIEEKEQTHQGLMQSLTDNYKTNTLKQHLLEKGVDPKKVEKALILANHEIKNLSVITNEDGSPKTLVVADDTFGNVDPSETIEKFVENNTFLKGNLPTGGAAETSRDFKREKEDNFSTKSSAEQINSALNDPEIRKKYKI